MAATAKKSKAKPEKRIITGPAGFALMRLAKKSGVYDFYRDLVKKRNDSEMDQSIIGMEMMLGISERIVDCETEFWDAASIVYDKEIDEVKAMDFEEVLSTIVPQLMEPSVMAFFMKTQAVSGK